MEENSILINLSQAIATLVAVVLAFLLSILSDRASWKHRKKEQIREHQIESLKEITSFMQEVDITLRLVFETKNTALKVLESVTSQAGKENRVLAYDEQLKQQFLKLNELNSRVYQEILELKLMRYEKDKLDVVENYHNKLQEFVDYCLKSKSPVYDKKILHDSTQQLKQLFDIFISGAEDGLTK